MQHQHPPLWIGMLLLLLLLLLGMGRVGWHDSSWKCLSVRLRERGGACVSVRVFGCVRMGVCLCTYVRLLKICERGSICACFCMCVCVCVSMLYVSIFMSMEEERKRVGFLCACVRLIICLDVHMCFS